MHPAIAGQLAQPRPRWWVLLLLYLAAAQGPALVYVLAYIVVRTAAPRVAGSAAAGPGGPVLQGAFFSLQVLAVFACTFHLLRKYRPAVSLLPPGTRFSRARTLGVVVLLALPVVLWYGPAAVIGARSVGRNDRAVTEDSALARSPDLPPDRQALAREMAATSREALRKAHEKVRAGFSRGPGVAAVLYTPILSLLLAPVFEELVFSGLALNPLCRRIRLFLAVPLLSLASLPERRHPAAPARALGNAGPAGYHGPWSCRRMPGSGAAEAPAGCAQPRARPALAVSCRQRV